MLDDIRLTLIS